MAADPSTGVCVLVVEGNGPERTVAGHAAAPGYAAVIEALDPTVTVRSAAPYDQPAITAASFRGVAGVCFTGSGDPWSPDAAEAAPQYLAMRAALDSGVPVYGSCFGMHPSRIVGRG